MKTITMTKPRADDGTIEIPVIGGMCRLKFRPGCSCGEGADSNPGIGFEMVSEVPGFERSDGTFSAGTGVFGRKDAKRLADAIYTFLETK